MRRERVGILGLGLIGGSLALALRKKRGGPEVWGCDRRKASVAAAEADGAIARGCRFSELPSCDIVVVCLPVLATVAALERLGPRMRPGTVLTDAGSVKTRIVRTGEAATAPGAAFVGGHPIAGTENSGYAAATKDLFRGRTAVVTPTAASDASAVRRVERIWARAGCRPVRMAAPDHDRLFAYVSHLPHVVAYALVHAVATSDGKLPLGYSAGGFRDFTRIASSNPVMWKDIVLENRDLLLRATAGYRRSLGTLEGLVRAGNAEGLIAFFRKAKKTRDGMNP